MKYWYKCPLCSVWGSVPWANRTKTFTCHACKRGHKPPTPRAQPSAYVDTHAWPDEMEQNVVASKGTTCTVPGCRKRYETLDHRVPYSKDGRTSVANLYPMCIQHNLEKGDKDYESWLAGRRRAG